MQSATIRLFGSTVFVLALASPGVALAQGFAATAQSPFGAKALGRIVFHQQAPGQTISDGWERVMSLHAGDVVEVTTREKVRVSGSITGASPEGMTLRTPTGESRTLFRTNISNVSTISTTGPRNPKTKMIVWGAIFGWIGAGAGIASLGADEGSVNGAAVGLAIGATGGALLGYATSRPKQQHTVIYQAK